MSLLTLSTPPPADLAPRWRRLCAYLVDLAVLSVLTSPLLVRASGQQTHHVEQLDKALTDPALHVTPVPYWATSWFVAIVTAVVFACYRIPQEAVAGRTLGHRLLGLRVVRYDGDRRIGFGWAAARYAIFYGVNVIPYAGPIFTVVNYLWCVFDRYYHQCLHDKVAGTFVLYPADRPYTARPPSEDNSLLPPNERLYPPLPPERRQSTPPPPVTR
ncbi:MAG TPA: RDD family protein [Streptosporangiales bacterium]